MDDDDFERYVRALAADAVDYCDSELSEKRSDLTKRYYGLPYGDEQEGRSTVRDRSIQTAVGQILPALMRTFFGAERSVEFVPRGPEDIAAAEQATEYVAHLIDRDGYRLLWDVFKDALIKRMGVIKYYWDTSVVVETESYTGLSQTQVELLLGETGVDLITVDSYPDQNPVGVPPVAPGGPAPETPLLHDISVRRNRGRPQVRLESIPPEEFLYDRSAPSLDGADFVGHRSYKTISELVSLGYSADDVEKYAGKDDRFSSNSEFLARHPNSTGRKTGTVEPGSRLVLYTEAYVRIDRDGDGHSELVKVCLAGKNHELLHDEPVPEIPFALFVPDPEPHSIGGQGIADLTEDLQRIRTVMLRNTLDSLAMSVHPRTVVVEQAISDFDEVLNSEIGAVIRTRQPGAVSTLAVPFVGAQVLPMFGFLREEEERRTGITQASQGLNSDALQSTTKAAVDMMRSASAARVELIARTFAEGGLKRLYTGVYNLLRRNQTGQEVIRMRGAFVRVDPRRWAADCDVSVEVPMGTVSDADRLQTLTAVLVQQQQFVQQMGNYGPIASLPQVHNTLSRMLELSGFKDSSAFFTPPPEQAPPPPPPKPTPEETYREVEGMKLELARQKMLMEDDRKRDELEAELALKSQQLELKHKQDIDLETVRTRIDQTRPLS